MADTKHTPGPDDLWVGEYVWLHRVKGGTYWSGGMSGQRYMPTSYKVLALSKWSANPSDGRILYEEEGGRLSKERLAKLIAKAQEIDADYPARLAAEKAKDDAERARRAEEDRKEAEERRLFDAAPGLLAACEEIQSSAVGWGDAPAALHRIANIARAAIAKAKGEK